MKKRKISQRLGGACEATLGKGPHGILLKAMPTSEELSRIAPIEGLPAKLIPHDNLFYPTPKELKRIIRDRKAAAKYYDTPETPLEFNRVMRSTLTLRLIEAGLCIKGGPSTYSHSLESYKVRDLKDGIADAIHELYGR